VTHQKVIYAAPRDDNGAVEKEWAKDAPGASDALLKKKISIVRERFIEIGYKLAWPRHLMRRAGPAFKKKGI
jgi:hypothetical protein